jgi:hypothetical protein
MVEALGKSREDWYGVQEALSSRPMADGKEPPGRRHQGEKRGVWKRTALKEEE